MSLVTSAATIFETRSKGIRTHQCESLSDRRRTDRAVHDPAPIFLFAIIVSPYASSEDEFLSRQNYSHSAAPLRSGRQDFVSRTCLGDLCCKTGRLVSQRRRPSHRRK